MHPKLSEFYYCTLAKLANEGILDVENFPDDSRINVRICDDSLYTFPSITSEQMHQTISLFEENFEGKDILFKKFKYIYCSGNHMSLHNLDISAKNVEALLLKYSIQLHKDNDDFSNLLINSISSLEPLLLYNIKYLKGGKRFGEKNIWDVFLSSPSIKNLFINKLASYHDNTSIFLEYIFKLPEEEIELFVSNIASNANELELLYFSEQFREYNYKEHSSYSLIQDKLDEFFSAKKDSHAILSSNIKNDQIIISLSDLSSIYNNKIPNSLFAKMFDTDLLFDEGCGNLTSTIDNHYYQIRFSINDQQILFCYVDSNHPNPELINEVTLSYVSDFIDTNLAQSAKNSIKNGYNHINNDEQMRLFTNAINVAREKLLDTKLNSIDKSEVIERRKPKI